MSAGKQVGRKRQKEHEDARGCQQKKDVTSTPWHEASTQNPILRHKADNQDELDVLDETDRASQLAAQDHVPHD